MGVNRKLMDKTCMIIFCNMILGPAKISKFLWFLEAYFIQNKVHSLLNSGFDRPIGKKIGCTTNVMQNYLKIDHPCAGTIRKSNCYKTGCTLNTKKYINIFNIIFYIPVSFWSIRSCISDRQSLPRLNLDLGLTIIYCI